MSPAPKTLCIAGKNEIAVYGLKLVLERYPDLKLLCLTNRNDPGYDTWQPSLLKCANANHVPITSLEACYGIDDLIFLSLEYDRIIQPERFKSQQLYNIHFSKLPAYKGMYTSALPLLHGASESGVTLHRIDSGIDTGEIVAQTTFPIEKVNNARELYFSYLAHSKDLLHTHLDALLSGDITSHPQSATGSSYFSKNAIDYGNLKIDVKQTAYQIRNQIRAFTFAEYQLPEIGGYLVNHAEITPQGSTKKPGTVIECSETSLTLATIDYDLILRRDKTAELMHACESGEVDQASECITSSANLHWQNGHGWTPLIVAAYHGALPIIRLLLEKGADVNQASYKGTTPLMYAMSHYENSGNKDGFTYLLNHGADTAARDISGKTIRDYAAERNVEGLSFEISPRN